MPWKARNQRLECRKCRYLIGGSARAIKLTRPDGTCPHCGDKMKAVRCSHPTVIFKEAHGYHFCTACTRIVDWKD